MGQDDIFIKITIAFTLLADFTLLSAMALASVLYSIRGPNILTFYYGCVAFISLVALRALLLSSKSRFILGVTVFALLIDGCSLTVPGLISASRVPWENLDFHLIYYLFALFVGISNFICLPLLSTTSRRVEKKVRMGREAVAEEKEEETLQ